MKYYLGYDEDENLKYYKSVTLTELENLLENSIWKHKSIHYTPILTLEKVTHFPEPKMYFNWTNKGKEDEYSKEVLQ